MQGRAVAAAEMVEKVCLSKHKTFLYTTAYE